MGMQDRPVPSVETSLKFMAWNHKSLDEKFTSLTNTMNAINNSLSSIDRTMKAFLAKTGGKCNSPETIDDALPF
jgi:hypothetical protein